VAAVAAGSAPTASAFITVTERAARRRATGERVFVRVFRGERVFVRGVRFE